MSHWLILPLVLPLVGGMGNLLLAGRAPRAQRLVSLAVVTGLLAVAVHALRLAETDLVMVYRLGNWAAPYGIVLVLDRLSALMLLTTAVVALPALLHALGGEDRRDHNFHVLFPLQLLGVNGAFLTGDLFNLFVCFEILLIASYGLALYGGGAERVRAGLHYVVLNLLGSAIFLIAIGVLYGITGTLNMADLASKAAACPPEDVSLLRAAILLLLVVFGLKAALPPLHPWLPALYGAAAAPVAAVFAIMTKVGLYALMRTVTLLGGGSEVIRDTLAAVLPPLALLTLAVGTAGVLGSRRLRPLAASLVVVSVGTLLAGIGQGSAAGLTAALYYLPHTTWSIAGLFLLADLIAVGRGADDDWFVTGMPARSHLLGLLFLFAAVAVAGLPPLSGFIGKLLLLRAVVPEQALGLWSAVLAAALAALIALSRAGSWLFRQEDGVAAPPDRIGWLRLLPVGVLLATSLLMTVFAAPVSRYAEATAVQLSAPDEYRSAVLHPEARP